MSEAIKQIMKTATTTYEEACSSDIRDILFTYRYGRLTGLESALHFMGAATEAKEVHEMINELETMGLEHA